MNNFYELEIINNPRRGEENITSLKLEQAFDAFKPKISIILQYIADKNIIKTNSLEKFVASLKSKKWESEEHLANHIIHQFYDQTLPFFVDLKLEASNTSTHKIYLVKKQPSYKITEMLKPVLYPL